MQFDQISDKYVHFFYITGYSEYDPYSLHDGKKAQMFRYKICNFIVRLILYLTVGFCIGYGTFIMLKGESKNKSAGQVIAHIFFTLQFVLASITVIETRYAVDKLKVLHQNLKEINCIFQQVSKIK